MAAQIPGRDVCKEQGHAWVTPSNGVSTGPRQCSRCGQRG